jgi:hypothetical protein
MRNMSDNALKELGRQQQWEGHQQDIASGSKAASMQILVISRGVSQYTHRESYTTKKQTKILTFSVTAVKTASNRHQPVYEI